MAPICHEDRRGEMRPPRRSHWASPGGLDRGSWERPSRCVATPTVPCGSTQFSDIRPVDSDGALEDAHSSLVSYSRSSCFGLLTQLDTMRAVSDPVGAGASSALRSSTSAPGSNHRPHASFGRITGIRS